MREASMEDITKFLKCKRVALVGVSRKPQHFSRALLKEFVAQGYDVVPVNPQAAEIDGRKCFARLADVTPAVEAALLLNSAPEATDRAVRECNDADIRNIWIYRSVTGGDIHAEAVEFCRLRGDAVVEGHCPFMFLPHPGLIHRFHGLLMRVTGSYPL